MSVRESERQKNCSGRGLGIAAAAIGVGVGAALYYFFSKRAENPGEEGSTSGWHSEEPHSLHEDTYSTVSEHTTTDTSIDSADSDDHWSEVDETNDSLHQNSSLNDSHLSAELNNTDSTESNYDLAESNYDLAESNYDLTESNSDLNESNSDSEYESNSDPNYSAVSNSSDSDFGLEIYSLFENGSVENSDQNLSENVNMTDWRTISESRRASEESVDDEIIVPHIRPTLFTDTFYGNIRRDAIDISHRPSFSYWLGFENIANQRTYQYSSGHNQRTNPEYGHNNHGNQRMGQANRQNSRNDSSFEEIEASSDLYSPNRAINARFNATELNILRELFGSRRIVRSTVNPEEELRQENFRQREWKVEECSICFDSMTADQEVLPLPCTHRFHQACIMPWLQEHQTCPMCRKDA